MTLKYIWRLFQPRLSFPRPFQLSLACFRVARSPSNSWASCIYNASVESAPQTDRYHHFQTVHQVSGLSTMGTSRSLVSVPNLSNKVDKATIRIAAFNRSRLYNAGGVSWCVVRKRPKSQITEKKSTEITEPKSQMLCDKITKQEATKIMKSRRCEIGITFGAGSFVSSGPRHVCRRDS